jgi:hypothetical protein
MVESKVVNREASEDAEMIDILEEMLLADATITARAVAKRHPSIQHASSITRHAGRSELLSKFRALQTERRGWVERMQKSSRNNIATTLAEKDQRIGDLQRQVEILKSALLAMFRVVGELGGMARFVTFYEDYREIREEMKRMGVMPKTKTNEVKGGRGEWDSKN